MKKTALIGLMALSIGGVVQAATYEFTDAAGDNLWATDGDGVTPASTNWQTPAVYDNTDSENPVLVTPAAPHYGVPTASDDVIIQGRRDYGATRTAVIDATNYGTLLTAAKANEVRLGAGTNPLDSGGNLSVETGAFLTANTIATEKTGRTTNSGTINLTSDLKMEATDGNFVNHGAVTIGADLIMQKSTTFTNNIGATFSGSTLIGKNADGNNTNLYVHGGTMNFTDITFFDGDALDSKTGYAIDFDGDGVLNLTIADETYRNTIVGYLTDAMDEGDITTGGVANSRAAMSVDGNTITLTAIPEPGTYALLAGCLGLTWVMLRRRRS